MLESLSDYLSLAVLFFFLLAGIYAFYVVSDSNHSKNVKERENRYYEFLNEMEDDTEDGDDDFDI